MNLDEKLNHIRRKVLRILLIFLKFLNLQVQDNCVLFKTKNKSTEKVALGIQYFPDILIRGEIFQIRKLLILSSFKNRS